MSSSQSIRDSSHAGSWYSSSKSKLDGELEGWLNAVKTPVKCIGPESEGETIDQLPVPGARVIIAPHAGYAYSGPAAAWAYKAWDVSKTKRVFLLGPSHHYHLNGAALSRMTHYATPLGDLTVDRETTGELHKTGQFELMSQSVDEDEHSLEMHLPYIHKMLSKVHGTSLSTLVPIMIGSTSTSTERSLAKILAPYLSDPTNAFVISSDFAHWGTRFGYTYYAPSSGNPTSLSRSSKSPKDPEIHESIRQVDFESMATCESGSHEGWGKELRRTGNTVCGRHPIGVMLAMMEEVDVGNKGRFRFVRYERSSLVRSIGESSVSYASAFAVI
ncbi:hypothetical protein B0A48_02251 [Cryoendolithus antarcticus]|uniref:MEMO1 family protein n=1 Tax=Cryoendolithus antarcticus TaxID=1507870 RepID=A0A1V8TN30_9PEZI|nr:hypothetical protein B0A48_02251 [Cryoendolithus antarcticus]